MAKRNYVRKIKIDNESHPYDKIIKENLDAVTPTFIKEVLHIDAVKIIDIPVKLQRTKEREPDFLKIIIDKSGRKFILHIEFQLADDAGMIFRMLEYYAMLRRKYPDLEIEQYVIFIGNKKPAMSSVMKRDSITYQFSLISLLDIDYKIFLQNDNPDEAIFAILANYGNEKVENIVSHIIQQIQTKNNSSLEQQKCYEQLRTLANLRNLQPLINLIMQSISQFFNKDIDPWYNEGHKKGHIDGHQAGHQVGHQEGRQEGRQEAVSEKNQQFTITLIQNTDFDNDKIATLVGVSVDYVAEIRASLKNN